MQGELLEPHEGITSTRRDGQPLVTKAGQQVAITVMPMLWSAALVGNQAPRVVELYKAMQEPKAGDGVVVLDFAYRPEFDERTVGYLVAHREREWGTSAEQWEKDCAEDSFLTEEDRWVEQDVYYIQYGPNPLDICRWTNCKVLSITVPIKE